MSRPERDGPPLTKDQVYNKVSKRRGGHGSRWCRKQEESKCEDTRVTYGFCKWDTGAERCMKDQGAIDRYREVLRKPGEVSNLEQKVEEEAEALEEAEQEAKEGAMNFPSSTRTLGKSDTKDSSPLPPSPPPLPPLAPPLSPPLAPEPNNVKAGNRKQWPPVVVEPGYRSRMGGGEKKRPPLLTAEQRERAKEAAMEWRAKRIDSGPPPVPSSKSKTVTPPVSSQDTQVQSDTSRSLKGGSRKRNTKKGKRKGKKNKTQKRKVKKTKRIRRSSRTRRR